MQVLRQRFDVVVYDAPPLGAVTDAALLARRTDGAILVVRHGHVRRGQVLEATRSLQLAGARVLGTVLTFSRDSKHGAYEYTAAPRHLEQRDRGSRREPVRPSSDGTGLLDELAVTSAHSARSDDARR
jgi:Mrp family chromosome partitioning ATPase